MDEDRRETPVPSHPFRWFPEFWELGRQRLRPQARTLGLALVIGVIAGVGAIAFYAACQVVVHYSLDAYAGYSRMDCQGKGEHDLIDDIYGGPSHVRIEMIVQPAVGLAILEYLHRSEFDVYAVTACIDTVQVATTDWI